MPNGSLFIVSDSLETAENLNEQIKGKLDELFGMVKTYYVRDEKSLLEAVINLPSRHLVVYAFSKSSLESRLRQLAIEKGFSALNAFEPTLNLLKLLLESPIEYRSAISHQVTKAFFSRLEALEFAVRHDDGRHLEGLRRADLVLIGVSRTSKTPLSLFLANRGLKVANVPIIYKIRPPDGLFELPTRKVAGLTISPARLMKIRQERAESEKVKGGYASFQEVAKEVEYAEKIMQDLGVLVIDVTRKAIEETAREVLEYLGKGLGND